jgi:hypothetical protein
VVVVDSDVVVDTLAKTGAGVMVGVTSDFEGAAVEIV